MTYLIENELPSLYGAYDATRSQLAPNADGTGTRLIDSDPVRWIEDLSGNGRNLILGSGATEAVVSKEGATLQAMIQHDDSTGAGGTFFVPENHGTTIPIDTPRWTLGVIRFDNVPPSHSGLISFNNSTDDNASTSLRSTIHAQHRIAENDRPFATWQGVWRSLTDTTYTELGDILIFAIRQSSDPDPNSPNQSWGETTCHFHNKIISIVDQPYDPLPVQRVQIGKTTGTADHFRNQWLALAFSFADDIDSNHLQKFFDHYTQLLGEDNKQTQVFIRQESVSPDLDAHQGNAINDDATIAYAFDTLRIDRLQRSDYSLLTTNTSPLDASMPSPVNHIGDGDFYNGKLYLPMEKWVSCADNTDHIVGVYDGTTLAFEEFWDLDTLNSGVNHSGAGLQIVPEHGENGIVYIVSFCDQKIYMYDLAAPHTYLGIFLDTGFINIQAIAFDSERWWISTSDGILRAMELNGTITFEYKHALGSGGEGLAWSQSEKMLYWSHDDGTPETVYGYKIYGDKL